MSVRQNVEYGLKMRGVPGGQRASRVDEALEMVQLTQLAGRAPRQLSGGQQQRVALARALVNRPRVLLLDEPLGALDLKLRKEMQLELKHLQTSLGITFVYVTHDQEEALTMSDRIVLMRQGGVAQMGTPRDLYDRPVSRYVADFIGETNLLPGTVVETAAGVVTLRVGDALLRGISDSAPRPGDTVWLTVRPEVIDLLDGRVPPAGWNSVSGTVVDTVYAGSAVRAHVEMPGGRRLVANLSPGTAPRIGALATLTWPVERGRCVAE
jgi:spermidine/putrescine transport system ATP-binding protein